MRRVILAGALVTAVLAPLAPAALAAPRAPAALAAQAHVVIAIVEDAVNVYHHDFADGTRTASPARWLPGYPASASPLRLHLRTPDYATARKLDDGVWATLKAQRLYYVPGTRISGLVWLPNQLDRQTSQVGVTYPPPPTPPRPVIDGDSYHGTGVTSVAAGKRYGACPDCDIVIVAADNPEDGLEWAARQPWIDVINNSWGGPLGLPAQAQASHPDRALSTGASAGSLAAARAGKVVVFGSGNGVTDLGPTTHGTQHSLTWDSPYAGPPWVLTVGASKATTGQPTDWHNIPVDVIAQGESRPAADSTSLDGQDIFVGTSCSAPIAAGVIAEALYRARKAALDGHVGSAKGSLLAARHRLARGPAADGVLSYLDLMSAARAVAAWKPFDPSALSADPTQALATPTTPAGYAYEGFGVLDRDSIAPLADVLLGRRAMPARPEMQQWAAAADTARTDRWGAAPGH
jgi:hypothetical protein